MASKGYQERKMKESHCPPDKSTPVYQNSHKLGKSAPCNQKKKNQDPIKERGYLVYTQSLPSKLLTMQLNARPIPTYQAGRNIPHSRHQPSRSTRSHQHTTVRRRRRNSLADKRRRVRTPRLDGVAVAVRRVVCACRAARPFRRSPAAVASLLRIRRRGCGDDWLRSENGFFSGTRAV